MHECVIQNTVTRVFNILTLDIVILGLEVRDLYIHFTYVHFNFRSKKTYWEINIRNAANTGGKNYP